MAWNEGKSEVGLCGRGALLLFLLWTSAACGGADQFTQELYEVHVTENLMVPMRDGVALATDIYRPARAGQPVEGPFPVVLFRIPYDKSSPGTVEQARFFVEQGYVYVAQDARGRYASEGLYNPFHADLADDGYDAVVWATEQPWSSGDVVTLGGSYGGLTQLNMGVMDPPGLQAQAIQWMWDNAYKTGIYTGGAFNLRRISWIVGQALLSQEANQDPAIEAELDRMNVNLLDWVDGFPTSLRPGTSPLALVPNYESFLTGVIENWRYGPFWTGNTGLNVEAHWDRYADVPIYWIGGWYDIYAARTPVQYAALSALKESPQKLIMGPWCHCPQDISHVGDVEFGPAATLHTDSLRLRWYDEIVRGRDTGILDEPPVRVFVMGTGDGHRTAENRIYHGGEWRDADHWPPPEAVRTEYYFHGDQSLRLEPPANPGEPTTYIHDPANPVPTVGGQGAFHGSWFDYHRVERGAGGYDQRDLTGRPLADREDVVVFQTEPLEEDVVVIGPIEVRLYASSSRVNSDFTAKLIDVYPESSDWPEGFALNFQDGVVRTTHRASVTETNPTPIVPGQVYELTIEIPPVANVFKRGNRIRIDISSSNFPRFDLNPGTMDEPWERTEFLTAENRIYHDVERSSHVVLHVIPQ